MKATLEFNLPEEHGEYMQAINGGKWEMVVFELDQHLRGIVKYSGDDQAADYAQSIRDKLHEIKGESGLVFSE